MRKWEWRILLSLEIPVPDFSEKEKSRIWKDGWHNIELKIVYDEASDLNINIGVRKIKLLDITKDFDTAKVFNTDETGRFFIALPNKSLAEKSEECVGGKMSKERNSSMFCSSFMYENLKSFMIGKSEKPWCIRNVKIASMPMHFKWNRKAWKNSVLSVVGEH